MKPEKRLPRGLAELSPCFSEAPKETPRSKGEVSLRSDAFLRAEENLSRLVCASFISLSPSFDSEKVFHLIEHLHPAFQKVFYLFLDSAKESREAAPKHAPFPLRDRTTGTETLFLNETAPKVTVGCILREQLVQLRHPRLLSGPRIQTALELGTEAGLVTAVPVPVFRPCTLAVFDFDAAENFEREGSRFGETLSLLDHCIFVLEVCSRQIETAYRWIRKCVSERPYLSCSVFFVGEEAARLGEFVFERLDEISSEFLGASLGFLGWKEGLDVRLNADLILEEANCHTQRSVKVLLQEMMDAPLLAS